MEGKKRDGALNEAIGELQIALQPKACSGTLLYDLIFCKEIAF